LHFTWCDRITDGQPCRRLARTLCSATWVSKNYQNKFRALNTLLNIAEYAITRKEHFSFLAKAHSTVTYPNPPSPAKNQYAALKLRVPGQATRCLSLSYFSLGRTLEKWMLVSKIFHEDVDIFQGETRPSKNSVGMKHEGWAW
jgi:hypothetical protein